MNWREALHPVGLILGGALAVGSLFGFYQLRPVDPPPQRLDCSAVCAPRFVLAGPGDKCNCAPDNAWLDKMEAKCGPVLFDLAVTIDGTFEFYCGRERPVGVHKLKPPRGG